MIGLVTVGCLGVFRALPIFFRRFTEFPGAFLSFYSFHLGCFLRGFRGVANVFLRFSYNWAVLSIRSFAI